MNKKKKKPSVKIILLVILAFWIILNIVYSRLANKNLANNFISRIYTTATITPTPYQFPYKNPVIPKNRSYRIVIVGDSMTEALGLNANVLRLQLKKYYPDSEFVTYNYGYSSTTVLTLPDRLTRKTKNRSSENPPILDQDFDLIIIESFGYNPLSDLTLEQGLKKQDEVLDRSVRLILSRKPGSALAFLTTIAPDPVNFAKGTYDLSPEQRKTWVDERVAYIKNHQKFAEERGIPVIDVYSLSLTSAGTVNRVYISEDNIHPSEKGTDLISGAIAGYIFKNKIFPE